jgi:hypothetical protein
MIPEQRLSTVKRPAAFLAPDDVPRTLTTAKKYGGVALNDPSAGQFIQVWTLTTDGADVKISAPSHSESVLFTGTAITEIDLAFDQNMRPFVTFVDGGLAYFRWYDTVTENQVTSPLVGASSPRCCLDDKRASQSGASDVILAYVKDGNLYFRAQRDRYGVEYLLKQAVGGALVRVGMGTNNRLHFEIGE